MPHRVINMTPFRFCAVMTTLVCAVAIIVCLSGCEMFASHTDPISGWQECNVKDLDTNKAMTDDYQAYLKSLNLTWKDFVEGHGYFKDKTGQHAVTILIGRDGTYWTYVLFYDQNGKRIKVKKWVNGHYAC